VGPRKDSSSTVVKEARTQLLLSTSLLLGKKTPSLWFVSSRCLSSNPHFESDNRLTEAEFVVSVIGLHRVFCLYHPRQVLLRICSPPIIDRHFFISILNQSSSVPPWRLRASIFLSSLDNECSEIERKIKIKSQKRISLIYNYQYHQFRHHEFRFWYCEEK